MFALEGAKRDEGERLFTGNNAACHDYGRAPTAPGFRLQASLQKAWGGNFQVVLQVAADVNAIRGCAKRSMRAASFSLCIRKAATPERTRRRKGRRKKPNGPKWRW